MQEKIQNISPIKQRLLQFADTLGISMRDFCLKTSVSRGTLTNNTGVNEETITKIFATFSDLSPNWVITGEGNMLKSAENGSEPGLKHNSRSRFNSAILPASSGDVDRGLMQVVKEQSSTIKELTSTIREQAETIEALRKEIYELKK